MKARWVAAVAAVAALVVAGIVGVATPSAGAAPVQRPSTDGRCTIKNFSPRAVVLGKSPVTQTFSIETSGCHLTDWSLYDSGTPGFFAAKNSKQDSFDPSFLSNSNAGTSSVVAVAYNADYTQSQRSFAYGFDLQRRVAVEGGTMNASPEPVRKGGTEKIDARFVVVDWSADPQAYVPFAGHHVAVQFRTDSGTYVTVKNVVTGSDGWVHTTATQSATGLWRVAYLGTTVFSPATINGDHVVVSG